MESDIFKDIMVYVSTIGSRIFRNNTAMAWAGKSIQRISKDMILIEKPRPIKAGLFIGSSDGIGWYKVKISEKMLGKTVAIFLAIETKSEKGKTTIEQENFIEAVNKAGGIGFVARSVKEVEEHLKQWQ